MVSTVREHVGMVLYGLLWGALAPVAMLFWAGAIDLPLRPLRSPLAGWTLAAVGGLLMMAGVSALAVYGRGLPMNAYPPRHYVARGIYRLLAHPIYVGFIAASFGVSIAYGSAAGLWLVSPVAALTLAALVLGYEKPDLQARFGSQLPRPLIALPRTGEGEINPWERVSVYLLVLVPWVIVYEAVYQLGIPLDAIDSHLPFERNWPVLQWTEAIYTSAYLFVTLTPLVVRSRVALRRFAVTGLIATAFVTWIYLTVPLVAPPRPFIPTSLLGHMLTLERASSNTVAAFPAFHFIWPLLAAQAWSSRGRAWSAVTYTWAGLIAISCITTGMHSLADIVFAAVVYAGLRKCDLVWEALRRSAEFVANSWREWRIGSMRVINHGFYAAAGAAVGFWLSGLLAGPELLVPLMIVTLFGLLFSAGWAQVIEGSPMLLRPLGYYGGIVGGLIGLGGLAMLGVHVIALMGALAVAMPWVQAFGRMRCLVQGCCHGGPAPEQCGIHYRHARSRVTQIAGLANTPLYPTPLYSILSNVVTGTLLFRMWLLGAQPSLVLGLYFIMNALARFVEESYRAEPQTPILARLHLYHWLAAGGLLVGVAFTLLPSTPVTGYTPALHPTLLGGTLLLGAFTLFITGVDFPASNRRFSRLASADPMAPDSVLRDVAQPRLRH